MHQLSQLESISTTQFDNLIWRNILNETGLSIKNFELNGVISPFGFEVLENKKFLSGQLRKFYIYIGTQCSSKYDSEIIAQTYRKKLFRALEVKMPEFLSDVVAIIENQEITTLNANNYICNKADKLIDIQIRNLKPNKDILDDYADYLICTIDAVLNQKGEAGNIIDNSIMRSRMFQLYLMLEAIFTKYLPDLTPQDKIFLRAIPNYISNRIDAFFNPIYASSIISEYESTIYQNLIKKRLTHLLKKIKPTQPSLSTEVEVDSYHHPAKLSIVLDKKIYNDVKQFIIDSYRGYI